MSPSRTKRIEQAIELAAQLVKSCQQKKTRKEKKREVWMARMMADATGRAFMTAMTDRCFRSASTARTADQLVFLLEQFGIPRFLTETDQLKFFFFKFLGRYFPGLFIPIIRRKIYQEMANVLLPENLEKQARYFDQCKKENIRININHLGEAILGEEEAARRLNIYLEDLANPQIEYISVKISTIYSQINMIGFENSLEVLAERLRQLYQVANEHIFTRQDGTTVSKFVNLDMEEYKDLELTFLLFQKVLDEPPFLKTNAGIVLQSYLPDSFLYQKQLTRWAKERIQKGGAPITLRLVKGANLAMEAVESSMRNWSQAPFATKAEADANFKRMLEYACMEGNAEALRIGIGSHNLFDIAYALQLRSEYHLENFIHFEMLAGMAEPMQKVIKELSGGLLLYCPEAKKQNFQTAVAYLIRRLDENCGHENFLRHFLEIYPQNTAWKYQLDKFIASCDMIDQLPEKSRRSQNRLSEKFFIDSDIHFHNEPDTDFSLAQNRQWANQIFEQWRHKKHAPIPLVIGGEEIFTLPEKGIDPSEPDKILYEYHLADVPLIEKLLASVDENGWTNLSFEMRSQLLGQAVAKLREKRSDLIGAMIADGGKTVWEADPEISEAIDFIEYYRKNWQSIANLPNLEWSPKGVILVTPPWNFPCSIPVSGIAAALVAGNTVIFKPAPEAVLVGWYLVQAFWEAGIPKTALQFINCKDEPVGSYLIKHPKVASVILTGATETAKKFLKMRPGLDLHAETGGKNAIIVTAMSDRDLAVRDIIHSAFSHSGQKCSACSLAILEAEVYEDPRFKQQLLDAASSLKVASAWDKNAKITPLIRPPEGALRRGLTILEEGESWLLKPMQMNAHLWSPGIKWGVKPGSFIHQTELFGPVLGVMRADNLEEAIQLANNTPYGLTSGLHSLDEREHEFWKSKIQAGNLYINRGITGAIVRRQPFGGCKASSFGLGAKAGGPNYVAQFARPTEKNLPIENAPLPQSLIPLLSILNLSEKENRTWKKSAENYAYWAKILKSPKDFAPVLGQDNFFYHVPLDRAYVLFESSSLLELLQVIAACLICNTPLTIFTQTSLPPLPGVTYEDEPPLLPSKLRLLQAASAALKEKAAKTATILIDSPVLSTGRFELLHYLREVSLSIDYHRYGYLGLRASQ